MLAERCWAYAMQLRQEANTEPRKKFHLVQKLRKSCGYALQLEELCKVGEIMLCYKFLDILHVNAITSYILFMIINGI